MTRNKTADLMRDGPPPGKTHPCPTCGTPVLTATGNRYCSLACLEATGWLLSYTGHSPYGVKDVWVCGRNHRVS